MKGSKIFGPRLGKSVVQTGDRVFSNGSILELVRIPSGELNLLFWDGKSAKTAGQFVTNNETLGSAARRSHDLAINASAKRSRGLWKYAETVHRNLQI